MTLCSVEVLQAGAEISALYLRVVLLNLRCGDQGLQAPFVEAGTRYVPQLGEGVGICAMAAEKHEGGKSVGQGRARMGQVLQSAARIALPVQVVQLRKDILGAGEKPLQPCVCLTT